jgi:hypothetical protein
MAEAARAFSGFDQGLAVEVAGDLILTRSHLVFVSDIPLVGNLTWMVRAPGLRGLARPVAKLFIYGRSFPEGGEKRHKGAGKGTQWRT